jgi:hypothetical protein
VTSFLAPSLVTRYRAPPASLPISVEPSARRTADHTPSPSSATRLVSQPGLISPSEVMNALVASPWSNCG